MAIKRDQKKLLAESDRLYKKYGKPFEKEHWGRYIAIFPDGKTVLGEDDLDVLQRALSEYGRGSFLFRVGEKAVFRL